MSLLSYLIGSITDSSIPTAPTPSYKDVGAVSYSANSTDPIVSVDIQYPADVSEGDFLFIFCHCKDGALAGSSAWNTPVGWTQLATYIGQQQTYVLLSKVADGTESGSVTMQNGSTGVLLHGKMYSFVGSIELEALQVTNATWNTGVTLNRATPLVTGSSALMVAFYGCTDNWAFATENLGSYTRDAYSISSLGGDQVYASYSWPATQGEAAGTLNMSTGYTDWTMGITLQLKPIE